MRRQSTTATTTKGQEQLEASAIDGRFGAAGEAVRFALGKDRRQLLLSKGMDLYRKGTERWVHRTTSEVAEEIARQLTKKAGDPQSQSLLRRALEEQIKREQGALTGRVTRSQLAGRGVADARNR